jgi:outer membrane protein
MEFAEDVGLRRKFIAAAAVVGLFLALPGPTNAAFDLLATYNLAKENDPFFRQATYENMARQEVKKQALAGFFPTLSAEAQYTKTQEELISSNNTFFSADKADYPTTSYSATLTQPLFNYSTWVGYQQAKSQISQAALELEIVRQDLIMRSADLYIKALSANDNLIFADSELAAVSLNNTSSEKRYSAGLVAVTDLYDSRARLSTSIAKQADARDLLDDSLRAIEEIAGQFPAKLASLRKEMPLISPEPADEEVWVSRALQQNPVLLAKKYGVEVADREIARQKSGHYPTLDLACRYHNRDSEDSLFSSGSAVATTEALVTLKLPLFQGGYISSRARQAKELHKAALEERQKEERAVERQVRSSYQGVLGSIKRVKALESALAAQEMTLQAKKKGFDAGLLTSLAVLDAERDLFFIKTDYATARYDYLINTLRLKRGAGILGEEDVVAVNLMLL